MNKELLEQLELGQRNKERSRKFTDLGDSNMLYSESKYTDDGSVDVNIADTNYERKQSK